MNEEDIPIDIHYNKLLDWLVDRRHCDIKWQTSVIEIRKKINTAIQDMPEHPEITQLLAGTYINYFHCRRIVEILKETEAASKNIFGRYSSQRMKDWQEILKLYEKDSVYLAEAAQLLIRCVNYEIPALKKQITRCQQQQKECTRKQGEYTINASDLKEKYHSQCAQLGIKGEHIKRELLTQVCDLPATFEGIASGCKALMPAVHFYAAFVTFTLNSPTARESYVPLVCYLADKGNTTVYEWKTGVKPDVVEPPELNLVDDEDIQTEQEDTLEIDWGAEGDAQTIDFGGITLEPEAGTTELGQAVDIDWGEVATDAPAIEVVDQSQPEEDAAVTTDQQQGVVRGPEALTVLDNPGTRDVFVDQLIELESFLTQRLAEMSSEKEDVLSGSIFQSAPATVQTSPQQVEDMLAEVQGILGQLTSSKMQDLLLIRSSPRYVDRLVEKLKHLLSECEKQQSLARLMVTRRAEAGEEQAETEPKVDLMRTKMRDLQGQIANEISRKYKNRRVNIMGDINMV